MSFFETANRHCLNRILTLARENTVIASGDLIEVGGACLWARGQAIDADLQNVLRGRCLRSPMELLLEVERSPSLDDIVEDCISLIRNDPAMDRLSGSRQAIAALAQLRMARLPGALPLLLAASLHDNPSAYRHILYVIGICAGFSAAVDMPSSDIQMLLMAALIHDLGELYVDPGRRNPARSLNVREWSVLVEHPRYSGLAASELCMMKPAVGLGVSHHHERLDGSGYPGMLSGRQVSRIGAILAAADGTAAILDGGREGAAHQASLAIRIVPEEFLPEMQSFISTSLRFLEQESPDEASVLAETKWVARKLDQCEGVIANLMDGASGPLMESLQLAWQLCIRMRKALRAVGVDYLLQTVDSDDASCFRSREVSFVITETTWRLRNLARTMHLRTVRLPEAERSGITALIELLEQGVDIDRGGAIARGESGLFSQDFDDAAWAAC